MSAAADTALTVTKSDAAEASSAHSRINIPLNLDNWKTLPDPVQQLLLWFHQHALDNKMSLKDCAEALDYDGSTIFRMLKGTYEGNWDNIAKAIRSYRQLTENRGSIQQNEFVETAASRMIFGALDYAMANNSMAVIIGESRQGKTMAAKEWRDRNNHGRSVYVIAPAYGGTKALLRDIAACVGVSRNLNTSQTHESVLRGFNRNRILIVDEAHRLLPGDRRSNPVNLEIVRDIHDRTGAAVAFLATQRFDTVLKNSEYMFEQVLGRIGMPVRLPRNVKKADVRAIVQQYLDQPSDDVLTLAVDIANRPGRLGILVETLKVASRIAHQKKARMTEQHFLAAYQIRLQMQGETTYAAK